MSLWVAWVVLVWAGEVGFISASSCVPDELASRLGGWVSLGEPPPS